MKFIIFPIVFFSSLIFAETSCIHVDSQINGASKVCGESDGNNVMSLRCNDDSKKCFTGSAAELVSIINMTNITDGDASIGNAVYVSDNSIKFSYGAMTEGCEQIVYRCK